MASKMSTDEKKMMIEKREKGWASVISLKRKCRGIYKDVDEDGRYLNYHSILREVGYEK